MKPIAYVLTLSLLAIGCSGHSSTKQIPRSQRPALPALKAITIQTKIPFSKNNNIAQKIKIECNLPNQLSEFIKLFAEKIGIIVDRNANVSKYNSGQVLILEILDSVSEGNVFIGHRKFTRVKGELYKDGQLLASFKGQRHAGGSSYGGGKDTCAVLRRTLEALAKDISRFLLAPRMNAIIGEG